VSPFSIGILCAAVGYCIGLMVGILVERGRR